MHWPALLTGYDIVSWPLSVLEPVYLWWLWSSVLVIGERRNPSWSSPAMALTWIWPALDAYGAVLVFLGNWMLTGRSVAWSAWLQWTGTIGGVIVSVAALAVLWAFRERPKTTKVQATPLPREHSNP